MSDNSSYLLRIIGPVTSHMLNDDIWRMFGFNGRPQNGTMINRLFRAKWKVDLESRLQRELAITRFAVTAVSGLATQDEVEDAIHFFIQIGRAHV